MNSGEIRLVPDDRIRWVSRVFAGSPRLSLVMPIV